MNKNLFIVGGSIVVLVILVIATGMYEYHTLNARYARSNEKTSIPQNEEVTRVQDPERFPPEGAIAIEKQEIPTQEVSDSKVKANVFTGTLGQVNTGCFSDGECYVVVDGRHVTVLMGWSQSSVGGVVGVASFGDLANHIGEKVEVYAQVKPDNTYTLYGSEGFYVKLLSAEATNTLDQVAKGKCVVGGCSMELCEEPGTEPTVSSCLYHEEYACYQTARCERQASGMCGWTATEVLLQCISSKQTDQKFEVQ